MTTPKIRLLLSDVDGTLVTSDKVLTERSIQSVDQLREAGILFALTSSRPPGGLAMYAEPLKLTTPISAFNGGLVTTPSMQVTDELTIDDDVIHPLLAMLDELGLSIWVYQGEEWFVRDVNGPHVQHEAEVVQFQPRLVDTFDVCCTKVAKIVAVDDDAKLMAVAATSVRAQFGTRVSATNSQSYYLDITNPQANKGVVVTYLSHMYNIPTSEIATIGDAHNDVLMFEQSGVSVAMGNAVDEVKASATHVTTSNDDEGFANAVQNFILK
jgi:Cof subfamily protein (haloacid dehalogenase superfamily)